MNINKKRFLNVITVSTLTLSLGLGAVLGVTPEEQAQAKTKTINIEKTSTITTVSNSKAVKVSGKYKTKSALNMRKGASTKYKKIMTLKKGTVVSATYKKTVNGKKWFKVKYKGKSGWVSASYIKKYKKTKKVASAVAGSKVVSVGKKYLGVPYVWGGMSPSGFDCSGFTAYVYKKAGYGTLPHSSRTQYSVTKRVSKPKVGDLIFFGATPGSGSITHVGIYAGNNLVLHAAGNKVQVQSVAKGSYWAPRVIGYGSL